MEYKTNKPINILYIIWSLGLGGAERVVINLAKGLDRNKFNPIVCCLNDKGIFARELENADIKVIALNKRKKIEPSIIKRIMQVIIENNIQIVHTHMWGANFWGRIAAKFSGVPVVIATEHNADIWKNAFFLTLDKWLSRWTDKIIAVSENVKEFYVHKGIASEKIEVIYNGVEITGAPVLQCSSVPVRKEFGIREDETVLAVIGRLVEQKGHKYLFEAISSLDGQYKVRVLVVGEGPLMKSLRSQVVGLRLADKVIFTGLRQDVPNLLKAIDILVMPSLREGLPMIALEAMASGVPVVATKVGGNPEIIIDGLTGILVEPKDHIALKEAISRLINDKAFAQGLISNSKKKVEKEFSIANMVNKTQGLYRELYKIKD